MNGGVIMHESVFDIMDGLEWPTDALAQPESIIEVEYEQEFIYAHQAPMPAEPGFVEEAEEREQVPDTGQLHNIDLLARALKNFQDVERIRYCVSNSETISELTDEDYYASEDESILDDEESSNSSNEYIAPRQMQL